MRRLVLALILLVGPPAFVQELGGRRKKAASISPIPTTYAAEKSREPVSSSYPSSPQWQEMIRKLVTDWYANSSALVGWGKLTGRI